MRWHLQCVSLGLYRRSQKELSNFLWAPSLFQLAFILSLGHKACSPNAHSRLPSLNHLLTYRAVHSFTLAHLWSLSQPSGLFPADRQRAVLQVSAPGSLKQMCADHQFCTCLWGEWQLQIQQHWKWQNSQCLVVEYWGFSCSLPGFLSQSRSDLSSPQELLRKVEENPVEAVETVFCFCLVGC